MGGTGPTRLAHETGVERVQNRRTVLLLVGIGLGVVAAVLAFLYLNQADERAEEKVDTIKVVRASSPIPQGTTGEEAVDSGLVEVADALEDQAPPDALTQIDSLPGTVAITDIDQGQIITSATFSPPEDVTPGGGLLADRLRADSDEAGAELQAVTISASAERGVAGLVSVGDRVNVMVFLDGGTQFMLQNMNVLALGSSTGLPQELAADANAEGQPAAAGGASGLFTLEGTSTQTLKLAQASLGGGQIYLSLAPTDFEPEPLTPPVNNENLFD